MTTTNPTKKAPTPNVPQLRFPEFEGEWEKTKLYKIADFENGVAHEQLIDENGKFIVINSKFISSSGEVKKYALEQIKPLYKNDIVMVMSDVPRGKALAKCFLVDKDDLYTLNQRICLLRAKAIDSNFLYRVLNRNKYYLSFDSGVGQTNLRKDEVINCPVIKPSLIKEQEKIAGFLTAVDGRIDQLRRKKELLTQYKKGLMQQLFSQQLRFTDDNNQPYPNWEEKKLGDIAEIYQPETISQADFSKKGYPVYGANGLVGFYTKYNHETWQTLVTCRGSTCGTVTKTTGKAWITGNAMVLNVDDNNNIEKTFFYYAVSTVNYSSVISGSGQPQITRKPISNLKLFVPHLEEQKKIAMCLSAMDDHITHVSQQLTHTQIFKQGLLQQLFV